MIRHFSSLHPHLISHLWFVFINDAPIPIFYISFTAACCTFLSLPESSFLWFGSLFSHCSDRFDLISVSFLLEPLSTVLLDALQVHSTDIFCYIRLIHNE